MPARDGTGPLCHGRVSGRGRGFCNQEGIVSRRRMNHFGLGKGAGGCRKLCDTYGVGYLDQETVVKELQDRERVLDTQLNNIRKTLASYQEGKAE